MGLVSMKFFTLNSIRNKLVLLVLLTVTPCIAILVYSGIEQRRHLIRDAQSNVLLLTRTIAEAQKTMTQSTQQILSTLSQTPTIQDMEPNTSSAVLRSVLQKNPDYNNFVLVDLNGNVIASGKPFTETNLVDRKHIKDALEKNDFAVGEYIVTRVGSADPAFAFAYPVPDREGRPKGVLAASLKLDVFSRFYDVSRLPEKSFLAITDFKGIRIFYYPAQEKTNPLGKPIQTATWNMASEGGEDGLFFSKGSDGLRRVFAYVKIHTLHEESPYLYVWAGIPESHILAPANIALIRNLLLLILTTVISIFISWVIGRKTLLLPIQHLVDLTEKFSKGDLEARSEFPAHADELGTLTTAFHDMAESLTISRKELEESDQRFKTVADFAYDWEFWVDQDGKFIYSSPSCLRITGYSPEEYLSDPDLVCKIVKPEYAEKVCLHYFSESRDNGPDHSMEYPILKKNGEEVWLEHNCCPVYDLQGKYAGRRGSNRDITGRKRTEAALLLERQYLIDVIDSLPDATFIIDTEHCIVVWNRAAEAMTNVTREDLLGKGDYAYAVPFYKERRPILIDLLNISEKELESSYSHVKRVADKVYAETFIETLNDGEGAYLWGVAAPLYDRNGLRIGAIEVIKDITELKKSEKANIHLQEQLIQAQKIESIGRLAGGVAHDFNNMLGVILGHAELAQKQLDKTEPLFYNLEEIRKAAQRSVNITRQLLAFARKQTIAPQIMDLNESVDGILTMLRRLIGEDINLAWLPGNRLGLVNMDPSQVDQILVNLIVNARDAIVDTGKITIETHNVAFDESYCRIHAGHDPGEYVMLAVSDNGCGMDTEVMAHLFEPFFTTKEMGKGTGLGLATIYGIVKQNNGFVNVHSELGHGTTFKIYLPRVGGNASPTQEADTIESVSRGNEVILIVEDEQMILNMTTRMLELHGYKVLPVATPGEAISLAQKHAGDLHLLLTDVVMPEMNGRDLARNLLSLHPKLKILFMSGYSANIIAHQGVLDEGVDFIQKPFFIKTLATKIREVLDKKPL
jgi:PAS domain S-box-containing protein